MSIGQWAAKLPAIKLWEWFDPGCSRTRADRFECGRGWKADFFFRPPTLTASNFAALWPTDSKFLAIKDLNLLKKYLIYIGKCANERFAMLSIVSFWLQRLNCFTTQQRFSSKMVNKISEVHFGLNYREPTSFLNNSKFSFPHSCQRSK